MPKKKSDEPFIMLYRGVVNSCAMRAASGGCRKAIDRIVEEHLAQGGVENGNLEVPFEDFYKHGITSHDSIMPALREACALGLIILTQRGRAGNTESRASHKWAVAFVKDRAGQYYGTEWKRFRTVAEAKAVAKKARAYKDSRVGAQKSQCQAQADLFSTPGNREWGHSRKPGAKTETSGIVFHSWFPGVPSISCL